jgi:CubicO group peptidase (beta-lactamase class C family)
MGDSLMKPLKDFIEACVGEGVFPGAAWLVGGRDGVFEKGAAGVLGNGLGPVREDSLYDLASLTKLFTTLALMKQFEDGLIRLDDQVDYFLPAFKNCPVGEVSLFRLLTHTGPFPGGTHLHCHARTREDLLEAIRLSGLRSDSPGRVVYTCEAFILLGEIAAAIDRQSLAEVIRSRVTGPLGMNDVCYNPPAALLERIAPTEDCPKRGRLIRGEVHDENAAVLGGVSGNAGLFADINAMSRFAAALLDSLDGRKNSFLPEPVMEMMIRNYTAGRGENRGLGWMIAGPGSSAGDLLSPRSFGHTGFTGTSIWIDPEYKLYAVLLSNRIHPCRDNTGIFRARHIFHNLAVINYRTGDL